MGKKNQQNQVYLANLRQQAEQADTELRKALSQSDVSLKLTAYAEWVSAVLDYRQEYQRLNNGWPKDDIGRILKRAEKIACDIWGTAQFLPEPPELDWSPNSKPHTELTKFYKWGVNATPAKRCWMVSFLWKLYEKTLKVIIDAVLQRLWLK